MADNLTAAQRAAFQSDYLSSEDFTWTLDLWDGSTSHDLLPDLVDFGSTDEILFGWHDKAQQEPVFPAFRIIVDNSTLKYSRDTSSTIWSGPVTDWQVRLKIEETLSTGSAVTLLAQQAFNVVDVENEPGRVIITAVHQLRSYWSYEWKREDRHDIDWNGNAHSVSL